MSKRKTHEEHVVELAIKNPNIEVLGTYVNRSTKIKYKCKIHNYEWMAIPGNILSGKGCPKCGKEKLKNQHQRSHDEYVEQLKQVNPDIEVLEEYQGSQINILHKCKIDGYEWSARPNNILQGTKCPQCQLVKQSELMYKTHNEYIVELSMVNPNIDVIEVYSGALVPIKHRCKLDNYEWLVRPSDVLHGKGCPKCAGQWRRMQAEYVEDVKNINQNIDVIGLFIDRKTKIQHKCLICKTIFKTSPDNILRGSGCPQCNQSHGERSIALWLNYHHISFIPQYTFDDCKDRYVLPFDFYLSDYNMCIEYDGRQHFEPVDFAGNGDEWALKQFQYIQKHDEIKNKYCKNNNIHLLRIPYFKNIEEELNNFYSFNIVTSMVV